MCDRVPWLASGSFAIRGLSNEPQISTIALLRHESAGNVTSGAGFEAALNWCSPVSPRDLDNTNLSRQLST
jgi:hypothetical protein